MKIRVGIYLEAVVLAVATATASSCSGPDSPADPSSHGDFDVYIEEQPGEVPPGTITTWNIRDFRVSAFNSSNCHDAIMFNVEVVRTNLNSWSYSPAVEWPDYPIDFEAVTPATEEITTLGLWEWGYPSTVLFDTHGEAKTDFCIAAARHIRQTTGRIRLNFRHAMARIDIKVASDIPSATLVVKKIDMFNVCSKSTFFFPRGSTFPQDQIGQLDDSWAAWTQDNANDTIPFFISENPEGIAVDSVLRSIGNQDNRFYIPYTFRTLAESNGHITGSGIRMLCKIVDNASGRQIWPDRDTPYQLIPQQWSYKWAYIFLPLGDSSVPETDTRNRWRPGYNYNYRIHINRQGTLPPPLRRESEATDFRAAEGCGMDQNNSISVEATPY